MPNCKGSSICAKLLQEEVQMPLFHDLTAVLQDPKQRRITYPIKDGREQIIVEVCQGRVLKGKEHKANCSGFKQSAVIKMRKKPRSILTSLPRSSALRINSSGVTWDSLVLCRLTQCGSV